MSYGTTSLVDKLKTLLAAEKRRSDLLQEEVALLRKALGFYANGYHLSGAKIISAIQKLKEVRLSQDGEGPDCA